MPTPPPPQEWLSCRVLALACAPWVLCSLSWAVEEIWTGRTPNRGLRDVSDGRTALGRGVSVATTKPWGWSWTVGSPRGQQPNHQARFTQPLG